MVFCIVMLFFFFFKQKTAYEMRISDWSSDVCSSDLAAAAVVPAPTLLPSAPHHDGHITTTERETMLDWIADPNIWASMLTLTLLEIVLGIDNIIYLQLTTERLAANRRLLAQRPALGLPLLGGIAHRPLTVHPPTLPNAILEPIALELFRA